VGVLGIGLDVCPTARMSDALARHGDRFAARVFTVAERAYADGRGNRDEAYAARFAAKEATSKALGAPRGIGWHDVEVIPAVTGERGPTVVLRGRAREVAEQRGVAEVMISITHAGGVAAAVAIAVGV
jgi:holo-[acyl-carrier protein] synthase